MIQKIVDNDDPVKLMIVLTEVATLNHVALPLGVAAVSEKPCCVEATHIAEQVFDRMLDGSHILHGRRKHKKGYKSLKFKFKCRPKQRTLAATTFRIAENALNVAVILQRFSAHMYFPLKGAREDEFVRLMERDGLKEEDARNRVMA